jgi:hypothetical protein
VDATGRIIHANASAHRLIAEGNVLRAANGLIAALDPRGSRNLFDVFAAAQAGDAAVGRRGIAMALSARTGEPYVVHVLPLTSGARRKAGVSYSAAAAMFIRKAELDWLSPPEAVAGQFKLTPAEVRVLFAIVEIGGVPEVALVLGISEQNRQEPFAPHLREDGPETASRPGQAGRVLFRKALTVLAQNGPYRRIDRRMEYRGVASAALFGTLC